MMKRGLVLVVGLAGIAFGQPASAETIVSVTQASYDANLRPECAAVRMNPAAFGSLPTSACTLGTQGTDGPDRITKTTYDAAGQVMQIDQAYGVVGTQRMYARYTYTNNGLKATERDANGNTTTYEYDGFDRLSKLRYPVTTVNSTSSSTTDYEQFTYDNNGNRTYWRRRDGNTISYTYDNLNREIYKGGAVADMVTSYDGLGHIKYKHFLSGLGVDYAYDGLGRVSSTTDMNGRTVAFTYDVASRRSLLTYPDGQLQGYNYMADGQLSWTGIAYNAVGYGIGFDALNRPGLVARPNGTNTYFSYDAISRLSGYSHDLAGTSYDITWAFSGRNPVGQITKWGASSAVYDYKQLAAATTNNTYDGLNRDASIAALTGGYDARGNMTFDGVRTMTYDLENRLKTVSAPGISLQLDYDPEGRLAKLTSSGAITTFLYDGVNLIGEYDGAGAMTKRYMHTLGTDQPWVEFSGSAVGTGNATYLYSNYQGSIIATADSTGAVTNLYKYGPYGEPKDGNNVDAWSGERFRYTGQIMIPEAKLYYYKARVYDPIAGRFLQTDPVGSKDDLDLYAYVRGDPVNAADPDGMQTVSSGSLPTLQDYQDFAMGLADVGDWLDERSDILFDPNIVRSTDGVAYLGGAAVKDVAFILKLGRAEVKVEAEIIKKVHGNTLNDAPATLYKKYDKDGNFLKHGVTQHVEPSKRYTSKQIDGGTIVREERGPRKEMVKKERERVETDPGSDNKEPWAGKHKNRNQ